MKRYFWGIFGGIAIVTVIFVCAMISSSINRDNSPVIIASNFPAYDFARAIVGDKIKVKMLIKPGAETHTFEPTPRDVASIKNSAMFIYNGGESETWVEGILKNAKTSVRMMDAVETLKEEGEDEEDEHVWTSPQNAIKIIRHIYDEIVKVVPEHKLEFAENAEKYILRLQEIDEKIRQIVSEGKRKTIVFGDRFPLRYFAEEYGLSYYAAFPGCSEQTEISAKTIAELADHVRDEQIPVVFMTEMSNGIVADVIADEAGTGATTRTFYAMHNISESDYDGGRTYADLMEYNARVLKQALN